MDKLLMMIDMPGSERVVAESI